MPGRLLTMETESRKMISYYIPGFGDLFAADGTCVPCIYFAIFALILLHLLSECKLNMYSTCGQGQARLSKKERN